MSVVPSVMSSELDIGILLFRVFLFQAGHLKMLEGYVDFFMDPSLAECYTKLKEELDKLIKKKVRNSLTSATCCIYCNVLPYSYNNIYETFC